MKNLPQLTIKPKQNIPSTPLSAKDKTSTPKESNRIKNFWIHKYKSLTIKIYEAKILVDVSVFGKMTTYAKVKLGPVTWQTSIDKNSHMDPKWNEVYFLKEYLQNALILLIV